MNETDKYCSDTLKKVEEQIMWVAEKAVKNKEKRVEKWERKRSSVYQIRILLKKGLLPIETVREVITNILNQLP